MTLLKSGWPRPRPRPRCPLVKHYPGAQGVIKPAAARPSTNECRFFVPRRPISRRSGWFDPEKLGGDAMLFGARHRAGSASP